MAPAISRAAAGLALLAASLPGCGPSRELAAAPRETRPDDVLRRCEAAYARLQTLQLSGVFRDERPGRASVVPIRWDFERPSRCRLQIGMDVMVASRERWWTYRHERRRFLAHTLRSQAALRLGALQLSEGARLVVPEFLLAEPPAREEAPPPRSPWAFEGLAWVGQRPCYVFNQNGVGNARDEALRIWIDQDTYFICQTRWERHRSEGPPKLLGMCFYDQIAVNQPVADGRFRLDVPEPIFVPPDVLDQVK